MLYIESLDKHQSSPKSIYSEPDALAERKDLYTGENFYFGFNSTNHTFIDIIGAKQPLAIKYGPLLSLYERTTQGEHCKTFYIDRITNTLRPIVEFHSSVKALGSVDTLIPWSFTDTYVTPSIEDAEASSISDESLIASLLELLATLQWPTPELIKMLPEIEERITRKRPGLSIKFADLSVLKEHVIPVKEKASAECFIALYNPFLDDPKIKYSFIQMQNPNQITVRKINDPKHPRIEIIAPGLPVEQGYIMLFKEGSKGLYETFVEALDNRERLSRLVKEHYPELIRQFFTHQAFELDAPGRIEPPKPK